MNIFFFLASLSFFLWTIQSVLFWVALWQVKEYRLDRFLVHIKETTQGRKIFFSPLLFLKLLLLFGYVVVSFHYGWLVYYSVLVGAFFLAQGLVILFALLTRKIRRPIITAKSFVIALLSFATVFFLYFFPLIDKYAWFLVLDRLIPCIVGLLVFFFSFPTEIYTDIQIQKATKKMKEHPNILVIGVSGSYGKSSTKEYLAHVLSAKYAVVKTPFSNNTPIGIAKVILSKITDQTQVFVVEMGAYKRGEVGELAEIVRPSISVTTSISDQHISLFKNLENVIATENELIGSLPASGIALFNGNSTYAYELYKKTKKRKFIYTTAPKLKTVAGIFATHIEQTENDIRFDVMLEKQVFHLKAPLFGLHNIENILPAVYIASYMGLTKQEIQKQVASLSPLAKTMVKKTLPSGIAVVDDTFNASPESVLSAISYMKVFRKKKALVLMPLIELGKEAEKRHEQIGKEVGAVCDYLFVTNKNYLSHLQKGIEKSQGDCQVHYANPSAIAALLHEVLEKGDVVTFEGKEAGKVLHQFSI